MFVPQSQAHHLSRSHGAPGTARRGARDKENAGALPSKTPVRAPLGKAGPSTARALGSKTVDRNILAPHEPSTDIAPKRLFQNTGGKELKGEKGAGPSQPLRVKTPAPQRGTRTPGPRHTLRTPAPQLSYHAFDPTPAPLPSAQRTRRRSRASFNTPPHGSASTASHHDPDASLDNILEADVEAAAEPASESDYELEYAPPTAVDRPYVPEWADSIPDPVETMAKLTAMRPMNIRMPPPIPADFDDLPAPTLDLCSDDELENPVLRRKKVPATSKPEPRVPLRGASAANPLGTRAGATAALPKRPATSSALRPATTRPALTARSGAPSRPASAAPLATDRKPVVRPDGPASATASSAARSSATSRATASSAARTATAARPTASSSARTAPLTAATASSTSRKTAVPSSSVATTRGPSSAAPRAPPVRSASSATTRQARSAAPSTQGRAGASRPAALRGLAARPQPTPPRSPSPVLELALDLADDMIDLELGELGLAADGLPDATSTVEASSTNAEIAAEAKDELVAPASDPEPATKPVLQPEVSPMAQDDRDAQEHLSKELAPSLSGQVEQEDTSIHPASPQAESVTFCETLEPDTPTPEPMTAVEDKPEGSKETGAEPAALVTPERTIDATPESGAGPISELATDTPVDVAEVISKPASRATDADHVEPDTTLEPAPITLEAESNDTLHVTNTESQRDALRASTPEPAELSTASADLSLALDFELAELSPEPSPVLAPETGAASPTHLNLDPVASPAFHRSTLARISEHTEPCDMSLETISDGVPHDCDM